MPTRVRAKPDRPDKPPKAPPVSPPPVVSPPPPSVSKLPAITGTVQTHRPGRAVPYGIPWSNITRWEPALTNAAAEFGVDPKLIAAMAVIESDGQQYQNGGTLGGDVIGRNDGFGDGPS